VTDLLLILCLFALSTWGLLVVDSLVRKIMALSMLNASVILLFLHVGARAGTDIPILPESAEAVVDPLPQALMLTAIVIGIAVTAVALVLVRRVHEETGTDSLAELRRHLSDRERR
jgi:multicomponent Na+:H+ antiporter subunit C